jgi:hypothetical protein
LEEAMNCMMMMMMIYNYDDDDRTAENELN